MLRIPLGHISVDNYKAYELAQTLVLTALSSKETNLVATINAQFYVLAASQSNFRDCLNRAEFLCADGSSICLASRWMSGNVLERIPGVELIGNLCAEGASQGLRVFFLGGHPGAAQETADLMAKRYPGLQVVGVSCPEYGFEKDPASLKAVLDQVSDAKPHMVFVGLGAPKQEAFIDQYLRPLKVPVAVGVGGSFEMLSGRLKRAPMWMQQNGIEWMFRFMQEPKRLWSRYSVGNVQFMMIVLGHLINSRYRPALVPVQVPTTNNAISTSAAMKLSDDAART